MKRAKSNLINGQKPEFGNLEHIKILQEVDIQKKLKRKFSAMVFHIGTIIKPL